MENFYIKDIKITCCDLESSSDKAISFIKSNNKNYICVTDAGNIVNAHRKSPELKTAINDSLMSLPDGKPVSILAKLKGINNIDRVAGPDFMQEVFRKTSGTGIKHFFLGDTEDTLNKLTGKISIEYDLIVSGTFSPEFGISGIDSDNKMIRLINESDADFIWISLGGGRQEVWMMNNYKKLDKGLMVGVGAAFRFFTGDIKRAPVIFQDMGFEWLFRLIQQPVKMFKRYFTTLPYFLIYSAEEIFKTNSN